MKSRLFSRHRYLQLIVFLLAFMAGAGAVLLTNSQQRDQRKLCADQLLTKLSNQFETASIHASIANESLVREVVSAGGKFPDFARHAALLAKMFPAVYSFQLAPSGHISKTFPEDAEPLPIGLNVLARSTEATIVHLPIRVSSQSAAQGSGVTASAPVRLSDGREAITLWQSVYLTDQNTRKFWGFTSVTLLLDPILDSIKNELQAEITVPHKLAWVDLSEDRNIYWSNRVIVVVKMASVPDTACLMVSGLFS